METYNENNRQRNTSLCSILPSVITDQDAFLDAIYAQPPTDSMTEYRNDIYAYLESTLAEILAEEWAEHTGEYAEPFQGYGRGE